MTTAPPLPCKFNAEHGAFASPTMLRQHYDEQHPEYRPATLNERGKEKVSCAVCGKTLARHSLSDHFGRKHPSKHPASNPLGTAPVKLGRPTTASIVAAAQAKAQAPPPLEAPQLMPDDIVMPVVEMLAEPQGLVPVSALPALFVWRDATVAMLRSVQRTK